MKIRPFSFFFLNTTFLSVLAFSFSLGKLQAAPMTFTVSKTADTNDGTCDADCSLREAIIAANTNPGADTIVVPAGTYTLTLTGVDEDAAATGDLDITESVTINGAGASTTIIDGNGTDRVFHIDPLHPVIGAVTVDLSGITIQNGHPVGSTQDGGGILNQGNLTLTNCTIRNNTAGTVNTAGDGGGIYDDAGPLVNCVNSTFSGNKARDGGALSNSNTATFTNCTISGNTATDAGGGILSTNMLTIINSTVVNNTAPATMGGGIFNADNTGGQTLLKNTIVANNTVDNCHGNNITSNGHNLDSGNTCNLTGTGDLINTNPNLGPLQNNGGPTETHALLPGSLAIDAVDLADCPPPAADQRGFARPQDGDNNGTVLCDIGAFEAAFCGNGILELGEQCDDGNTANGDCCDSTCQFEAQGSTCDDGNATTSQDQCDGAGKCVGTSTVVEICNNGIDDDGDGLVDCADPDCSANAVCTLAVSGGGCGLNAESALKGHPAVFLLPFIAVMAVALKRKKSEKKV